MSGFTLDRLWRRDLNAYPKGAQRWGLLLLVVISGIALTSLGLVSGAIAPLLFKETGMSTAFYSHLLVVAGLVGAATAYFSALSDRIGRANMIVYGALAAGLIATFGVPLAHTKWEFAVWYCIMGFADGISLVGTATLMRDFTPQTGRATAMGINTLGTGASALLISFAATHLLVNTTDWRIILHVFGGSCLVAFVFCALFLRELPPHLRAKIRATTEDELAIERMSTSAEDAEVVAEAASVSKWALVLNPRILAANVAIMLYLIIFVTAAGFLVLYNTEINHLSLSQANNLGTLFWGVNCVALVAFGLISDALHVRKPVMFAGAVIVVISIIFIVTAHNATYWRIAIPMAFWSLGMGGGFSPWYAAYSEDAEAINPALVGTVFAVFGVFNRLSSVIAGLVIPKVVGTEAGWHHWFLTCMVFMILYIPLCAYGLKGPYSPRTARRELAERSRAIQQGLVPAIDSPTAHLGGKRTAPAVEPL